MDVIETLPMVPLRDVVVFPHMMMPFVIGRQSSIRALEYALARGKRIFLSAQHDATRDNPTPRGDLLRRHRLQPSSRASSSPTATSRCSSRASTAGRALEFREEDGFLRVVAKLIPRPDGAGRRRSRR